MSGTGKFIAVLTAILLVTGCARSPDGAGGQSSTRSAAPVAAAPEARPSQAPAPAPGATVTVEPAPAPPATGTSTPASSAQELDLSVAWDSRPAGPGVPALRALDAGHRTMPAGGQLVLRAGAPPGARVQFRTFDSGRFTSTGRTIAQVQADAKGVAQATYEATPGVIDDVHIVVSSPDASDRLEILLTVTASQPYTPASGVDP